MMELLSYVKYQKEMLAQVRHGLDRVRSLWKKWLSAGTHTSASSKGRMVLSAATHTIVFVGIGGYDLRDAPPGGK